MENKPEHLEQCIQNVKASGLSVVEWFSGALAPEPSVIENQSVTVLSEDGFLCYLNSENNRWFERNTCDPIHVEQWCYPPVPVN